MQCTKTTYPHSKYNYVSCLRRVERFSDTPSNYRTPSEQEFVYQQTMQPFQIEEQQFEQPMYTTQPQNEQGNVFQQPMYTTQSNQETQNTKNNTRMQLSCSCYENSRENFADVTTEGAAPTAPTTEGAAPIIIPTTQENTQNTSTTQENVQSTNQETTLKINQESEESIVIEPVQEELSSVDTIKKVIAEEIGALKAQISESKEEEICNKLPLQIIIVILVLVLLGLIAYHFYDKMNTAATPSV